MKSLVALIAVCVVILAGFAVYDRYEEHERRAAEAERLRPRTAAEEAAWAAHLECMSKIPKLPTGPELTAKVSVCVGLLKP